MDRIQTEPSTLHSTDYSAPLNRNLQNTTAESNRLTEQFGVGLSIRGRSAGSYAGMVWEEILAEFPNFIGTTVLAAVASPPTI